MGVRNVELKYIVAVAPRPCKVSGETFAPCLPILGWALSGMMRSFYDNACYLAFSLPPIWCQSIIAVPSLLTCLSSLPFGILAGICVLLITALLIWLPVVFWCYWARLLVARLCTSFIFRHTRVCAPIPYHIIEYRDFMPRWKHKGEPTHESEPFI